MKNLGYSQPLYILAFDHRASFIKKLFGWEGELAVEQREQVADFKKLIYEGFEKGLAMGIPKDHAAILVEEEFGDWILKDAKAKGCKFILTSEKSGQDEFEFQYGEDFPAHIEKYGPAFTKALVRYNPQGDRELNARQAARLKELSDYSHTNGYKFLIEPLIPPTDQQLADSSGDKKIFDMELRPKLAVAMIRELQEAGVEPDIWKIEGLGSPSDYESVVSQAKSGGRDQVSVVVLGRAESPENVEKWLLAGRQAKGVIGFAIGRTIFWEALEKFRDGKSSREEAALEIGGNYHRFYQVFTS